MQLSTYNINAKELERTFINLNEIDWNISFAVNIRWSSSIHRKRWKSQSPMEWKACLVASSRVARSAWVPKNAYF